MSASRSHVDGENVRATAAGGVGRARVLFLTDSLGLPRLVPEPVRSEDVWVTRVARDLSQRFEFFYYTQGGLHTRTLVENLPVHVAAFDVDVVLLQVGIVDCAPRALSESEIKIVIRLPKRANRWIHEYVKKNYSRLIVRRDMAYVSVTEFVENLRKLRGAFGNAEFVVVPIGTPNERYRRKNPLIQRNVARYNAALAAVFGEQSVASEAFDGADLERMFVSDNHHLSEYGHGRVAEAVCARLRDLARSRAQLGT